MIVLEFLRRASITGVLEGHGYRGSGLTWMRASENAKHVVEFQVRRLRERGSVSFTINLGVVIEAVWTVYYGRRSGRKINEADCFPRFRVGDLITGQDGRFKDVWWTIGVEKDDAGVAAEVKACVTDHCLPVMDRLRSIAAVYEYFLPHKCRRRGRTVMSIRRPCGPSSPTSTETRCEPKRRSMLCVAIPN